MNELTLQEFTRQVAMAMGFEWTYAPPKNLEDPTKWGQITGPDGCAIRMNGDGWNWENSDRLRVWGTWPESIRRQDGQRWDFQPYRDNRVQEITCAISRGPRAIAGDILRRYVPEYLVQWQEQVEHRDKALREEAEVAAAYEELGEALNVQPSNHGCDGASRVRLPYSSGDPYGEFKVSAYGGLHVKIEADNLPMETALQIARLLAAA